MNEIVFISVRLILDHILFRDTKELRISPSISVEFWSEQTKMGQNVQNLRRHSTKEFLVQLTLPIRNIQLLQTKMGQNAQNLRRHGTKEFLVQLTPPI